MIRQTVRADIEKLTIRTQIKLGKGQKGLRGLRRIRRLRYCRGDELDDRGGGGHLRYAALAFPFLQDVRSQHLPVGSGQIMRSEACREQQEDRERFHSV